MLKHCEVVHKTQLKRFTNFPFFLQKLVEPYVEMARPYLDIAYEYTVMTRDHINKSCQGLEAWQIITLTFGVTLLLTWLHDFIFEQDESKLNMYNL